MSGSVQPLQVFDDGGGPALYAGGEFTSVDGGAASRIARWDGSAWSSLGAGMTLGSVQALGVFDDGGGPDLYAGGSFLDAGGQPASRVARWDGSSWSALGAGMNSTVHAFATFDHGDGPALYAGGSFALADGPALYVGGRFHSAGGASVNNIARGVLALATFDPGDGPSLHVVGGGFGFDAGDAYLARWDGCAPPTWADLGGGTAGVDGIPSLTGFGPLTVGSTLTLRLTGGPPFGFGLLFPSLSSMPAPFLGGTLHALPFVNLLGVGADFDGDFLASAPFPGGPPGAALWLQVGLVDAGVPVFGASLSNAVKGSVP